MNMEFRRKLPIPKEIKEMYPINEAFARLREQKDKEVKDILSGQDDRLLLLVGPCSADNETAVLDYLTRLRKTADEVAERILIVPRVYTSKPRTTGIGYKGMLHQPDPEGNEDMLKGIIAIRETDSPCRIVNERLLTAIFSLYFAFLLNKALNRCLSLLNSLYIFVTWSN